MVPAQSAHDTIAGLGEVGLLQFKDLSADKSAFQRTYASQVNRDALVGSLLLFWCAMHSLFQRSVEQHSVAHGVAVVHAGQAM